MIDNSMTDDSMTDDSMIDDATADDAKNDYDRKRHAMTVNAASMSPLQQRIIETADEYHLIAEDQWDQSVAFEPVDDESIFEFRRLMRASLLFYMRAYLALKLVESDDSQQVEDLIEIVSEENADLEAFFSQNSVLAILDEEGTANISQLFAVAEAVRSALLERSVTLAATLPNRFEAS